MGWTLAAIWLLLTGLLALTGKGLPHPVMPLLALIAGILLLLGR